MENYYKYLPVSEEDESWGLCVLNAGCNVICRGEEYPARRHPSSETHMEMIVNKGRFLMREHVDSIVSVKEIAARLNVGYSWFRKVFSKYTGMSPGQYLIQLKINKARQLLSQTGKSVKEVAFELNFSSGYYFSTLFKKKTGMSPESYRKEVNK